MLQQVFKKFPIIVFPLHPVASNIQVSFESTIILSPYFAIWTFALFFKLEFWSQSGVLKCFVHVLKLLDGHVDRKIERVDGESLDGAEAVVETYINKEKFTFHSPMAKVANPMTLFPMGTVTSRFVNVTTSIDNQPSSDNTSFRDGNAPTLAQAAIHFVWCLLVTKNWSLELLVTISYDNH